MDRGADFVVAATLDEFVAGMNKLTGEPLVDAAGLRTAGRVPATASSTTRSPRICR